MSEIEVVRLNREESLQGKKGSNARGGYKAEISGINKEENPNKLDISVDDKKTYKKLIRRKFSRPAGCRKSKLSASIERNLCKVKRFHWLGG